ncbi:MAG: hypothetical protein A2Y80_08270 [Deltaproteobacteria bacterium RBG_13_58_19]|nr:MAG: hypothetical protein A2Y80_08270 [Deltaproteobacteria bacterium RBG_13_58_19]
MEDYPPGPEEGDEVGEIAGSEAEVELVSAHQAYGLFEVGDFAVVEIRRGAGDIAEHGAPPAIFFSSSSIDDAPL